MEQLHLKMCFGFAHQRSTSIIIQGTMGTITITQIDLPQFILHRLTIGQLLLLHMVTLNKYAQCDFVFRVRPRTQFLYIVFRSLKMADSITKIQLHLQKIYIKILLLCIIDTGQSICHRQRLYIQDLLAVNFHDVFVHCFL